MVASSLWLQAKRRFATLGIERRRIVLVDDQPMAAIPV
jgi:hypothetical protein